MPHNIVNKKVETVLSTKIGRKHCLLTSRGATAIYLILKALNLPRNSEVIMPSFLCVSPAIVTLFAELRPVFCDIDLSDCNMDLKDLENRITGRTKVIIAPHMFGSPIDMKRLLAIAKANDLFVIEDCAQSIGTKFDKLITGSFGHAAIFSFGKTKIADVGYGGAVLTDKKDLFFKMKEIEEKLPEIQNITELSKKAYSLFSSELNKKSENRKKIKKSLILEIKDLYVHRFNDKKLEDLEKVLADLDDILEERNGLAKILTAKLQAKNMLFIGELQDRAFHRACFMVRSKITRDKIVRKLRENELYVGTLYPSIHSLFSDQNNNEFKNSIYAEEHIINYILDPKVTHRETIRKFVDISKEVDARRKKLLVLGGSHFYAPVIKLLQEKGLSVLLVDKDPNPVGKKYANFFENIDIVESDAVIDIAKKYDIDAVMAINDYGVMTASKVASALGLIGNYENVALATTNKAIMRQKWYEADVPIPKFKLVTKIYQALNCIEELGGYPVIIKPSNNMGASKGILKISSDEELKQAFSKSQRIDKDILLEEYLIGSEHSVEGLVYQNKATILAISDKIKTPEPFRVDKAVQYPSRLSAAEKRRVESVVIKAAKSLGVKYGAIHAEVCYTKSGPKLFELASRPGGGRIPNDCLPLYNGINMSSELAKLLLDEDFSTVKQYSKSVILGFITPPPGTIQSISGCSEAEKMDYVYVCESLKKVGDDITEVKTGGDRAGYFIVKADNIDTAYDYYQEMQKKTLIRTEKSAIKKEEIFSNSI
jgi:dTDP-4-amino-4,6-dideoxygalactose transaminase/biotin carboxylase